MGLIQLALVSERSRQLGIDVAGIGRPAAGRAASARSCRRSTQSRMHQHVALAEHRVEARIAERRAALDAGGRHLALDGGEFERQRRGGRVSPASASASKPSTSILMKAGMPCRAISASSVVTRHANGPGPGLALPARRAVGGLHERLRGGRDRRIVDIELELDRSFAAADRDRLDRDRAVAAVEQLERR